MLLFIVRGAIRSRSKIEQVSEEVRPLRIFLFRRGILAELVFQIKLLKLPSAHEVDLQKAVVAGCALSLSACSGSHVAPIVALRLARRRCCRRERTTLPYSLCVHHHLSQSCLCDIILITCIAPMADRRHHLNYFLAARHAPLYHYALAPL